MKLFLLNDVKLTLKTHHPESREDKDDLENATLSESEDEEARQEGGYWLLNSSVATKLEPLDAENSFQNQFCHSVKALLESLGTEDVTAEGDGGRAKKKMKKSMDWNVSLGMKIDYHNPNKDSVSVFINGRVLEGLHQISVPHKQVTVQVILKDFVHAKDIPPRNSNNGARWAISELKDFISTSTKEMMILPKRKWAGCCDNCMKIPLFQSQWSHHLSLADVFAETAITLKFTVELTFHFNQDNVFFSTIDMQRKVLENGFGTDVIIRSGDGEEFRSHKNILAVNSPVLDRILSSGFKEALSGIVDIPDMTGEAVKSMISFFYCRDLTAVSGNPCLAMELLEAGEKYDIDHLKKAMAISLALMNEESWTADIALRLYLFAGQIDLDGSGEVLKKKSVGVMKKNATDLKNSQEFQELFKNQPQIAFELFQNMCEEEPKK